MLTKNLITSSAFMRSFKKILTAILILTMVLSSGSFSVFASEISSNDQSQASNIADNENSDSENDEKPDNDLQEKQENVSEEKTYSFSDKTVSIKAVAKENAFPDNTKFVCKEIKENSEKYDRIIEKISDYYNKSSEQISIIPYDMSFISNGKKLTPKEDKVDICFDLKDPIRLEKKEKLSVIHMENGERPEKIPATFDNENKVENVKIKMDSFSPVVLTKVSPKSGPLKAVESTNSDGDLIYISKTPNVKNDGTATTQYSSSQNITDVVSMDGAIDVDVVIQYATESTSYDWLYIKDANGNIIKKDADGKQVGDSNGKIGGGGSNRLTPSQTVHYRFEQDELQFVWRTDGSVTSYGYYAVLTPTIPKTDIPDFHFEELEDGTYALVFDKGGNIDAFANRPDIKERIAEYKSKISEVRLHKDTTKILNGAFKGLSSLTKVTIPRNSQLDEIGKNVFANCENLKNIDIPATVTTMSGSAFKGCKSLEKVTFAAGNEMTTLPDGLFESLTELTDVTLPVGLTSIPNRLFNDCKKLSDIDIPESVTKIGSQAFKNTAISDVDFLDQITEIGSSAFSGCTKLTKVSIPENVTKIGSNAFENCSKITDFIFEDGTSFDKLPERLFSGCTSLTNVKLPGNLTRIPNYCFSGCSKLQKVDMPNTVTAIGDYAFSGCSLLQDFEIPENVKTLGPYAFQNCKALKDMEIPKTVSSIGTGLFNGCTGLIRVRFEDDSQVTSLANNMFEGCNKLETVKLPDNVTTIPASYFKECTSLKNVELPKNITTIGDYAFYNCYNIEDIELKTGLKTIGERAFYNCDKINDIVVPKTVTSIGYEAFKDCSNLKSAIWEEGSPMTSMSNNIFYGCSNLENLVLPSKLTGIPSSFVYNCSKLKNVEIPSTVKKIGSSAFQNCTSLDNIELPAACTGIDSSAFYNTGLTHIDLPANLGYIGSNAFRNTKINAVTIPNKVTSVGDYAFYECKELESVDYIDGGSNSTIGVCSYANCGMLKDIHLKEKITRISGNAFENDKRLTNIEIPASVTQIDNYAFRNDSSVKTIDFKYSATPLNLDSGSSGNSFGKLSSVEEINIDRDITSGYKNQNTFSDINPEVKFVIGEHVNTLDNMFVSLFTDKTEIEFKGKNDFSVSTRLDNKSEDAKWSELKGDFYVDENGVVYKLNKTKGEASLFHIPKDITDFTLPEKITSVAGKEYTITKIDSYSLREAKALTHLTVEKPENVSLPQFSLAECPSLLTVNDKDEIFDEDWADVSLLCGFPVHSDEEPQQVLALRSTTDVGEPGDNSAFSFGISISGQEKMADDGLTYVYPTGMSARMDFAISNESNVDMSDRVIRMYFAFDGDNYTMGNYPVGDYTLVNTATNSRYPFKVRATEAKGVYYYDITGFKPGDTLAFNNNFAYLSPKSGGGTMRIWVDSISTEEAARMEGKVSQPKKYILSEWYTQPTPYNLNKSVNGNPQFEFVSNPSGADNDDNIYVKNLSYKIDLTSGGSSGSNYAKDYIKYIDFSDDLKLNKNMQWNPKVIEAVQNDDYYIYNNVVYAKVDEHWVNVCSLSFSGGTDLVRDIKLEVVKDDNDNDAIRIKWSYKNTYWSDSKTAPSADIPATAHYINIGTQSIQIKQGSDLWKMLREGEEFTEEESAAMRQISNSVDEVSHYSFSKNQTTHAETANRPIYLTTGFNMKKRMVGESYFGRPHAYEIDLINSGLVYRTDIDAVTDTLRDHYYIRPENIEKMFNEEKWGHYLSLDITSATLCEIPDKEAVDVYGNAIPKMTAQESGAGSIPYNGKASTDNSVVTSKAKLSFHWNDEHTHLVMKVKNDAGEVQQTKSIGQGCDYESVKEALDGIGFVVTRPAVYKVTWNMGDEYTLYNAKKNGVEVSDVSELTEEQLGKYEYKLKSGKTDTFKILSHVKDTTMMIAVDETGYYPSSSLSSDNTAYAVAEDGHNIKSASWSGYIYRELTLSKSASANGQSWSSNIKVPDDTVIDYTLSFYNRGESFDVMPLSDKMSGSQVLLVPIRGNKNAMFYAEGSSEGVSFSDADLDVYDSAGILYYVLDKAGSYKDVTIDGRLTDTIKVTRNTGSAQTLMIWYYQDVTGKTANSDGTTRTITYKALADSARLGAAATDEHGSTQTSNSLGNESWLGGHPTHRLYAALNGSSEQIQFKKSIVEDPEAHKENLINHSLIKDGDEVLYKMELENTGESEVVIKGNRLRDTLPSTAGIFSWSKENVKDIYYVTQDNGTDLGSSVETQSSDYWYVNSLEPGTDSNTASRGLYYIRWTNDFEAHLEPKGKLWIYVKLKYPDSADGDTWDNYIAKNNGSILTNYFYVDSRESHVTHELVDVTEGKLQKGVLDTGLSRQGYFKSEDTRHFYQNGANIDNGSVQETIYYTAIYNSGNVRLYLDPLQDQLPKGFKFRGLINGIPKLANTDTGFPTNYNHNNYNVLGSYESFTNINNTEYLASNSSYLPVATVKDGSKTISYRGASVSAQVSEDGDGHQQVTYTFGTGNNLRYDSSLGKYYLNPGEAVRFGYICTVEGHQRTENVATNEISMPVYDKYGLGVHTSGKEVEIIPAKYRDIAINDGSCDMTTTEEEMQAYNHTKPAWAKNTTDWFSSNVSMRRLSPVPGVLKSVAGESYLPASATIKPDEIYGSKYTDGAKGGTPYTGTISRTSIANWLIKTFNEGGTGSNSMEDYWIEDTVDSPYMFTGNFFYDFYSTNGTRMSSSSIPVFSLGGRSQNDTHVKISTGEGDKTMTLDGTIVVNGAPVTVDKGRAEVQLLRDNEGVETLRIHFKDNYHRIPPNSYMALYAHTQYVSSDAVLSKQFYNHVELKPTKEFDPALVSQGKVLYREVEGEQEPYAIESGASVTMTAGYSSAARKKVTELGNDSNTGWSDREKNFIELPEKYSKFAYDLYVDLPKDDPTSKLVLIDSLPQPNDHSPFVVRDKRNSEFMVHMLSDNLGFKVWTAKELGNGESTEILPDEYKFEVSIRTDFSVEDWEGEGDGWVEINLADGLSDNEKELVENARSFRLTLNDEDVVEQPGQALMGKNHQVHVKFNAELANPENADPGTIAWNSFGYRYTVPIGATGISTSLNAEPLKVGVLVPSVPFVNKDLKTPNNNYKPATEDSEYRFLIYSGSAISELNDTANKSIADIANILSANSRDVMITNLTVERGKSTGKTDFLDEEKKWTFNGTNYVETDERWIWNNHSKYTIIELPWEENGYVFSNTQHSPVNNYTFTQNSENNVSLRVTNEWNEKGDLKLEKTVRGPSYDPNRKFTFTIKLKYGKHPVFGTYEYSGTNIRDGSISFDDTGEASIQLKHNQKIEIHGIPAGYTYQVTESNDPWYESTCENANGTIETNVTKTASFTNTRKDTELSVSKTVQGNFGNKIKPFTFEVYVIDEGRELSGDYTAKITHKDNTTTDKTLSFNEGAARFELKHGDTINITGLPVGARYEVDEIASSRTGYEYTSTNDTGVLAESKTNVSYINTKWGVPPTGVMIKYILIFIAIAVTAFVIRRKSVRKNKKISC